MARRRRALLVAVAFALSPSVAAAQKKGAPPDGEPAARPKTPGFWKRVMHPHREEVLAAIKSGQELVDEGRRLAGQGRMVEARARFEAAVKTLRRAVELEPHSPEARFWLGVTHLALEEWKECAEALEVVAEEHPGFDSPLPDPLSFQVGLCLALSGRVEESLPHYRRVLAWANEKASRGDSTLHDLRRTTHWNLGDSYQALGRLDEAVAQYRAGLDLERTNAMLWFALGVAYDRDGQIGNGWDAVREGLKLDGPPFERSIRSPRTLFLPPEDQHYYLGFAYQVAGQRLNAVLFFRRYLDSQKGGPWTSRAREHLEELGRADLTEEDVRFLVGGKPVADARVTRAAVRRAGDLQDCLTGRPLDRVRVQITVPPKAAGGKETVRAVPDDPVRTPESVLDCVERNAARIRLPRLALDAPGLIEIPVVAR